MHEYINGAILEAVEKAEVLKGKIPSDTTVYFEQLAVTAEKSLDEWIRVLYNLLESSTYQKPEILKQKFSDYKQVYRELEILENVIIAALMRSNSKEEVHVNLLVDSICKEIKYPLIRPVTSCLSQDYYHIYPVYNLLCVPLLEGDFLLHLPDIYHELAHPLLESTNRKAEAFQQAWGRFNLIAKGYFDDIIDRKIKSSQSDATIDFYQTWKFSWTEKWSVEFFCDLFGIYTLGPAFAWANLHLCVKSSANVYQIPYHQPTSHPPDDARMRAMFYGLELIGYQKESQEIESKWNEFKHIVGHKSKEYYENALPNSLIEAVAKHAFEGTKNIGCELAPSNRNKLIVNLLNGAWIEFWKEPIAFVQWESEQVKELKSKLQSRF